MLKSEYTFDLFSRYRGELMGLAIIGVLIAHIIGLGEISNSNILIKSIAFIPRLAFTQGFLFLSGFGLCYSFSKNSSIKRFYTRRLRRLMIPFIILSAWYYIFLDFIETCNPVTFILHLSSIAFWIVGNYNGMWYIGISVLLYSLFPLFYKLILTNKGGDNAAYLDNNFIDTFNTTLSTNILFKNIYRHRKNPNFHFGYICRAALA